MENIKKRKGRGDDGGDDEVEEEVKMDQFYSLLRSFRDARNRRRKELEEEELNNERKKKTNTTNNGETSTWVPSFEWTDFTAQVELRRPPSIFPTSSPSLSTSPTNLTPCDSDKGKKDQHQDDALDLKLAL